jgi:hypothetical protein
MTIMEAIARLDALKFNTYTQADKIEWLSKLDSTIKKQIIDTHEGSGGISFNGYTEDTPVDTVLLVPAPFDEVYLRWMEAQIDYHNGEYDKFNASIIMYNTAYEAFANYYKREHMPISRGNRFIF